MKKYFPAGINFRLRVTLILLIMVAGLLNNDLFPRNPQAKPSRQSSLEAFSKGNYEQAYKEFSELLLTYSKDPMYRYYSGVCLVKLNKEPDKAETFLHQALQSAAAVKSLPEDALFYLGRAQQMSGKFAEAIESFNLFSDKIGKKAAREFGTAEFIQQCNEKKGELAENDIKPAEKAKTEIEQTEIKPVGTVVTSKSVEKVTSPKIPFPISYEKILDEALLYQFKADSVNSVVVRQKKELEKLPNADTPVLKLKISENELLAVAYQKSADQKYLEAQAAMEQQQREAVQQSESKNVDDSLRKPDRKAVEGSNKLSENTFANNSVYQLDAKLKISAGNKSEKANPKELDKQSDTTKKSFSMVYKPIERYSVFEVLEKPVSDPNEKIIIDPKVPVGLIYRIQIAVFRNPVAPSYFKGITPVYGFKIEGTDKTNYYAGMFRRITDASKALTAVKSKGFKDAFVIAFSGNKPVSADRAKILEKEWGKKPFVTTERSVNQSPVDTIPPTLTFRVEVMRSLKPQKADIIEGYRKAAGIRGLDIQPLDDGKIAYLIGNFITFESAAEYADLLIRNGNRAARVVAWLGKKEIPVETARQLFENMK